jgi:hypothetical protein
MITAKFSLLAAFLAASCSAETTHLRRQLKKVEFCKPVALSIDPFTGLPKYEADVYFAAVTNGAPLDGFALQAAMPSSYNGVVDCSYLLGSTRELLECEVVGSAVSEDPNAVLVKCAYLSNSKDGETVIENVQEIAISRCACLCEQERQVVGLFLDDQCSCFCEPQKEECQCTPPASTDFVSAINAAYSNSTIGETADARITRMYELDLFGFEECGSPNATTFNITGVCPGLETAAFSRLFTEPPTDSPTGSPTTPPTVSPTEFPSEAPTEFPTDSPTESPTDSPTESPTVTGSGGGEEEVGDNKKGP